MYCLGLTNVKSPRTIFECPLPRNSPAILEFSSPSPLGVSGYQKRQVWEKGLASMFLWSSFVLGGHRKIHQESGFQFKENICRLRDDDLSLVKAVRVGVKMWLPVFLVIWLTLSLPRLPIGRASQHTPPQTGVFHYSPSSQRVETSRARLWISKLISQKDCL